MKQSTTTRKNIPGAMSAIGVRPAREWMGNRTAKCVQQEDANVADVTDRCQLNTLTAMRMSARHVYQNTIGDVLLEKSYKQEEENPDLRKFLAARQEAIFEDIA